ncbi:ABC transporter ATP-binding protein [uncultured Tessaracoccus sp.]|uniref:ABC transporter ATP-binding protein n=1 Tax=uncultured Tessaracoccus sp. TaxID=905023 RepID=UPI0025F0A9A2|nr:ABC transporter ATP-binding protein [uncultured Tessaracoccus sp.]
MRNIVRIVSNARELWPLYAGIIVGAVVTTATTLLMPFIISHATQTVVDMSGGERDAAVMPLVWLAVALLGVMLLNSVATNVTGYLGDMMSTRIRRILSHNYFHKLLRLPQRYFDTELTGTIISRLDRSITTVSQFLQVFANGFFTTILTVLVVLVVAAWHSPWLALLLIVIYPTFVWLTAITSKRWQVWEKEKNRHYDTAGGRFAEVVGQLRVVKSFTTEPAELRHFDERYDDAITLTAQQSRFWHWMDVARRGALDLVFFLVYLIIFVATARGTFSIGSMVLLIQLIQIAKAPVTSMSYYVDTMQRAVTGSNEYYRVMDEPDEPYNPLDERADKAIEWSDDDPVIELRDVDFGYEADTLVLHDINLAIRRGERIAFVGESGGGKSTLVNLLLKLYAPDAGTVRVRGQDVTTTPTRALRRQIGVVFQDASLFSGTVRDNLHYGDPTADDDALRAAARRSNALHFIDQLPQGFDTPIGERGVKLSGGQKQRIAVARAMLKDAPILVLDEATSALDTKAERQVQAGLDELMAGRTALIIAHRLSTISSVDRIVTLRDGTIDEVGSPAELAQTNGIYAQLLALQATDSAAGRKILKRFGLIS